MRTKLKIAVKMSHFLNPIIPFSPGPFQVTHFALIHVRIKWDNKFENRRGNPDFLFFLENAEVKKIVFHNVYWIEWLTSSFTFFLQLFGLLILGVGIWAWKEKDIFSNIPKLTNIALDPAFVLIILGLISFVIGFTGALGALRENTCLLSAVSFFLMLNKQVLNL